MFIIIRKHIVSKDISVNRIRNKYLDELEKTGVLMSSWDMNFWIRKTFSHRSSTVNEESIVIELDDYDDYLRSTSHESLVDAWVLKKPNNGFELDLEETMIIKQCKICLSIKGCLVKLKSCDCLFHKECIMNAVKYSDTCPLCKKPIKAKNT